MAQTKTKSQKKKIVAERRETVVEIESQTQS